MTASPSAGRQAHHRQTRCLLEVEVVEVKDMAAAVRGVRERGERAHGAVGAAAAAIKEVAIGGACRELWRPPLAHCSAGGD